MQKIKSTTIKGGFVMESILETIKPKSDQLNADDLMAGPITVTITGVTEGSAEQPVIVHIEGRQPYKPCKSMRRVMVACWGDKAKKYIGQRMTLYCDPSVKFGGEKVGGIRISHVTGIDEPRALLLTTTRSKRAQYIVNPLTVAMYPPEDFDAKLPKMLKAIGDGKMTPDEVIAHCRKTGELTEEQVCAIKGAA
jgi:hypothetical protein